MKKAFVTSKSCKLIFMSLVLIMIISFTGSYNVEASSFNKDISVKVLNENILSDENLENLSKKDLQNILPTMIEIQNVEKENYLEHIEETLNQPIQTFTRRLRWIKKVYPNAINFQFHYNNGDQYVVVTPRIGSDFIVNCVRVTDGKCYI